MLLTQAQQRGNISAGDSYFYQPACQHTPEIYLMYAMEKQTIGFTRLEVNVAR